MNPRPVCGLFPAYPSAAAPYKPASTMPGLQPLRVHAQLGAPGAPVDPNRRVRRDVVYIEGRAPRVSAHPVRQMPVFPAAPAPAPVVASGPAARAASRAAARSTGGRRLATTSLTRWSEEPLVVGAALVVCAPIGVTLLWASPRFSREARLAVTVFVGFALSLVALVALVASTRS